MRRIYLFLFQWVVLPGVVFAGEWSAPVSAEADAGFGRLVDACLAAPKDEAAYRAMLEGLPAALEATRAFGDEDWLKVVRAASRMDAAVFERRRAADPSGAAVNDHRQRLAVIDQMLPRLAKRPLLRSRLMEDKASVLARLGAREEAYVLREQALTVANDISAKADLNRLTIQFNTAELAHALGKTEVADRYYYDVAVYPFHNLPPGEEENEIFEIMIRAASGLVKVRRADPAKLADINIAPAIQSQILPQLNAARGSAGLEPIENWFYRPDGSKFRLEPERTGRRAVEHYQKLVDAETKRLTKQLEAEREAEREKKAAEAEKKAERPVAEEERKEKAAE